MLPSIQSIKAVPNYLLTEEYSEGVAEQYGDNGKAEGWVAKRWNEKVRERFALLLEALGKEFDGKIEGINLQETSIGVNAKSDPSFLISICRRIKGKYAGSKICIS